MFVYPHRRIIILFRKNDVIVIGFRIVLIWFSYYN